MFASQRVSTGFTLLMPKHHLFLFVSCVSMPHLFKCAGWVRSESYNGREDFPYNLPYSDRVIE